MNYDKERAMMNDTSRSMDVAAQSYNTIGAEAKDVTSVERQMNELANIASSIIERAEHIERRLAPVLRPSVPDGNMKVAGEAIVAVPLAAAIQMERMRIEKAFMILGDIIERIEI